MAVNVPLVHISDLAEATTASDTSDYLVIGAADAKKIKWGTIFNLIKAKFGTAATKSVINNLTTTSSGSGVLDAYQGKILKDAIDKINTSLTFKSGGTATGKNTITLPSSYKLLIITASVYVNSQDKVYQGLFLKEQMNASQVLYLGGYYYNATDYSTVCIDATATTVAIRFLIWGGKDYTSSAKLQIRYTV